MKNIIILGFYFFLVILASMCADHAHAGPQMTKSEIKTMIRVASHKFGVDPKLALAIAQNESGLNPDAIGSQGEVGVFQLHPQFHSVRIDERKNIITAIIYLAKLKQVCSSYGDAFFVCYNYGTTRKLKNPRSVAYYKRVKCLMKLNYEVASESKY